MDPSLLLPVVAWLASDEAGYVSGQVIRAMGEQIHLMGGWTEEVTISATGQALGRRAARRPLRHRRVQDMGPRPAHGRLMPCSAPRRSRSSSSSPSGSTTRCARSSTSSSTRNTYPEELIEQMKQMGVYGLAIPAPYGDFAGVDPLLRPRHRGDRPRLDVPGRRVRRPLGGVEADPALRHRGAAARYLPRMATGELRATMALTEPDGGSDLQAMRTVATPVAGGYVINGSKTWITNARTSGLIALLCKTDPFAAPPHRGISILLVEKVPGLHGVARSAQARVQGRRVVRAALRRLPRAGRCTARRRGGQGLPADDDRARDGPHPGRRPGHRRRPGGVRRCRSATPRNASAFGVPIWQHQSVGNLLADMATQITAAQQLNYHAADCIDSGRRADMEAGMAKLFCSEMAAKVDARRDPHPRRARLLDRVRRRALLPRRPADDRRRGHQRGAAQRHRQAGHRPQRARLVGWCLSTQPTASRARCSKELLKEWWVQLPTRSTVCAGPGERNDAGNRDLGGNRLGFRDDSRPDTIPPIEGQNRNSPSSRRATPAHPTSRATQPSRSPTGVASLAAWDAIAKTPAT